MKKTALQKILAVFAIVAFAVAMMPLAMTSAPSKPAVAAGESITNITKMYFPDSGGASQYYRMTYGTDAEYGDYVKLTAFATSTTLRWYAFDVKWEAGVTYDITLSYKTSDVVTGTLADAYILLNGGIVNDVLPYGFHRIDSATPEWKTLSFVYTPTADATSGMNAFAFNIYLAEGDEFYISNMQVVKNAQKDNLFSADSTSFAGFTKGEGTAYYAEGDAKRETVFNYVSEGNKNTLTFVKDVASVNSFYTNVAWEEGYDYRLSFNLAVTKGSDASNFRIMPLGYLNGTVSNLSVMHIEPRWFVDFAMNFSFVFSPAQAPSTGSNALSINIWNNIKAGDVYEFTDIRIDKLERGVPLYESDCSNVYDFDNVFWGTDNAVETIEFGYEQYVTSPVSGAEVFYNVRTQEGTGVYELWNNIDFVSGVSYDISYWVMTNEISDGLYFQPAIYDAAGHQIVMGEIDRGLMVSSKTTTPNVWKKCIFTYTHEGEDFRGALKFIYGNAMALGDTVYLSDVKVVPREHVFTAEVASEIYLKTPATSTEGAVYYKSCIYCGASSEGTEYEGTFTAENESIATIGASVRVSDKASIRFISEFDKAQLEGLDCDSYKIGTILKGGELTSEQLTVDTAGAVKIENGAGYWAESADKITISGYIEGIDEAHYGSKISARAYIEVHKGDSVTYIYADVITRSLSEVAEAALNDVRAEAGGEYIYEVGDGTYSCYDGETRAKLESYIAE